MHLAVEAVYGELVSASKLPLTGKKLGKVRFCETEVGWTASKAPVYLEVRVEFPKCPNWESFS